MIIKVPGPEAAPDSGIDWADAGIGAGTIIGLSLIGAGGALVLVHRRQSAPFRASARG
jgi:hypothetical protein